MIFSPQWALLSGIVLSLLFSQNTALKQWAKTWSTRLLQLSIILLGSALNFSSVIGQGMTGVLVTFFSILSIFLIGLFGLKFFKIDQKLGLLVTMGTAICGGSAIGALAPVIAADSMTITISMAIVFLLNAVSVFIFPPLSDIFHLSQDQFGTWAALAIHDTSSVVAASSMIGTKALEVATTLKLTRALWIIPVSLLISLWWRKEQRRFSIPWFVLGFLGSSLAFTFFSGLNFLKEPFLIISKNGFALTLLLIGLGFDIKKMREIGAKPLVFALMIWLIVSGLSLLYVKNFL